MLSGERQHDPFEFTDQLLWSDTGAMETECSKKGYGNMPPPPTSDGLIFYWLSNPCLKFYPIGRRFVEIYPLNGQGCIYKMTSGELGQIAMPLQVFTMGHTVNQATVTTCDECGSRSTAPTLIENRMFRPSPNLAPPGILSDIIDAEFKWGGKQRLQTPFVRKH